MIELVRSNIRLVAALVLVVILLAVNVVFLMDWRGAESEKADAEAKLSVAEVSLTSARVQYDLAALRQEEADLMRNPEFPTTLPVVGLSLFLAEGAMLSDVHLDTVDPPEKVENEKIGGKSYPAYATQVKATGSMGQIISFLKYIEGGAFSSIRVEDLHVEGGGSVWTAELTVVVISQT
jgi:hypothetical protein